MQNIWLIVAKKLTGETTSEEDATYVNWSMKRENNYFSEIVERIRLDRDYESGLQMKDQIYAETFDKIFSRPMKNQRVMGKILPAVASVAACIAMVIGSWMIYHLNHKNESTTHLCQTGMSKVFLPDSSLVILNAGSSITYIPAQFNEKYRKVSLSGEAFFEVKHSPKQPFIVQTERINVKVLGTVFNMEAYPDQEEVITSLLSGSVELNERFGYQKILLAPGQESVYNKYTGQLQLRTFDMQHTPDWLNEGLIFNKASFRFICRALEQKFNLEFEILNHTIENKQFTGKFIHDESLFDILETIKINAPFSYQVKGNKVIIY